MFKMYLNILVWLCFVYISSSNCFFNRKREGRLIDIKFNKYSTHLPSIHDVTQTIYHYRMPLAVAIPVVRINLGSSKRVLQATAVNSGKHLNDQLDFLKQNQKQKNVPTMINRSSWIPKEKVFSIENTPTLPIKHNTTNRTKKIIKLLPRNFDMNSKIINPYESNVEIIPFLYKDNLNIFTNQYPKYSLITPIENIPVSSQPISPISPISSISPIYINLPNHQIYGSNLPYINNINFKKANNLVKTTKLQTDTLASSDQIEQLVDKIIINPQITSTSTLNSQTHSSSNVTNKIDSNKQPSSINTEIETTPNTNLISKSLNEVTVKKNVFEVDENNAKSNSSMQAIPETQDLPKSVLSRLETTASQDTSLHPFTNKKSEQKNPNKEKTYKVDDATVAASAQFDISQANENVDDIVQENVHNIESYDTFTSNNIPNSNDLNKPTPNLNGNIRVSRSSNNFLNEMLNNYLTNVYLKPSKIGFRS